MASSQLTEDDVRYIFDEVRNGPRGTQAALAIDFGVSQQTINAIAVGRCWSEVTGAVYEKRSLAKITPETVLKIDADLRAGVPNKEISAKYSLPGGTVSQIKSGKRWTNVTGRPNRRPHNA